MTTDRDARRLRAELRLKRAEAQSIAGAEAKAEYDTAIKARDANTERLKQLRMARDEKERTCARVKKRRTRMLERPSG